MLGIAYHVSLVGSDSSDDFDGFYNDNDVYFALQNHFIQTQTF